MGVLVLRLGHRPDRDKRITTHVALTARALGAEGVLVTTRDEGLADGIRSVAKRFGGNFRIETGVGWRSILETWKGHIVHLTMYGIPLAEALPKIPRDEPVLVVVGAEKVPAEIYQKADFNVSVGSQPHSEVAALAVFLDRYFQGKTIDNAEAIPGGEIQIIPSEKGKKVVSRGRIPNREECLSLLKEAGCSENVIEHTLAVECLASRMAKLCAEADLELVSAGALLHDIGRGATHDIMHCHHGAIFAESHGLDRALVNVIRRHIGAGLDEEEREMLGLPPGEYIPETIEEKIVAHADNLIEDTKCRPLSELMAKLERKGLEKAAKRVLALHRELEDALGVDLEELCSK